MIGTLLTRYSEEPRMSAASQCSTPYEARDDAQLLQAFLTGDAEALAAICQRHWGTVRGYLVQRLDGHARDEADDLTQKVFEYMAGYPPKPASVTNLVGFLCGKAFRFVQNYNRDMRRAKRDRRRTVHINPCPEERGCEGRSDEINAEMLTDKRQAEKELAREEVRGLLDQLTPPEAEVVRVRLEGHTAESAAKALGMPQTTYDWRYRKAWARLLEIAARGR